EGFDAALAGQAPAHLGFEVAQVNAAVEHEAAGGSGEDFFGGDVEFVFHFTDELLDGVFDGDEAGGRAELVDDNGEMAAAILKLVEQVEDGLGFRHDEDFAHDLLEAQLDEGGSAEAGAGGGARSEEHTSELQSL